MPHKITLIREHQEILIEALYHSLNNKIDRVIKDDSKIPAVIKQYEDAAEKLLTPVHCGRKDNNIFTWLIDQLQHSPGVLHTELVQRAILICRYAAENEYQEFTRTVFIRELFIGDN